MKIISLAPKTPDTKDMLDVLEQLRAQIVSGEVVAFAAATVSPDDTCCAWAGSSTSVSRLRMQGAIAQLLHNYLAGDV